MKEYNLKHQFISGVSITFITKYFNIFVNILISAILARILTPHEFGIVAVVMVFTTFFQLLSQLGIGPAIIQNKQLNDDDISSIFKFLIFVSLLIATAFFFFSYIIAGFYDNQVYIGIGQLLSISVFVNTLNSVPLALLSKEKKFKAIGIINVLASLLGGTLAIILALKGFSYYSIVFKSIAVASMIFVLSFLTSDLKIRRGFNMEGIHLIKSYSSYQFMFNFINYFSRNLDNILIGKFIGPASLGYYDRAYRLMMYPVQNLTHVITPVIHPLLSEYQDNKPRIYVVYKKLTKYLMMLGIPVSILLFFYAKEFILIFYGDQWLSIVPTFKILSISIFIQIVLASSGSIFQAAGKTNLLFLSGLLSALTMVTGISTGVIVGKLEYVATGILIAMLVNFFQGYYILINLVLKESLKDFMLNLKIPCYIGIILIALNIGMQNFINISYFVFNFIFSFTVNLLAWVLCIYIFKENEFMQLDIIIKKITMAIKKRRSNSLAKKAK